jgi:hypothetical protein
MSVTAPRRMDVVLTERQVIPAPIKRHAVENVLATEVRTICLELTAT